MENGLFGRMCKEATDELASTSWRELPTNTLVLACFGMLMNHLTHSLTRPLWWFAGSVSIGVIGYIIKLILD